jgi:hypothetical protein
LQRNGKVGFELQSSRKILPFSRELRTSTLPEMPAALLDR